MFLKAIVFCCVLEFIGVDFKGDSGDKTRPAQFFECAFAPLSPSINTTVAEDFYCGEINDIFTLN